MRLLGILLGLTFALPTQALAAAPDAVDDSVNAEGAASLYVLLNDSDPDVDALRVTGTSAPAHGTVTCGELGGCLYTVTEDGYTGPDSFTYTLTAGGETDTATVSVTVVPRSSSGLQATDDDLATTTGVQGSVNVLANDTGSPPLQVTADTDGANGTVDCTSAGACTYTPNAGFAGGDGFTYTMADASMATRTANVRVLVGPGGFAQSVGGSPAQVIQGESASWSAAITSDSGDEVLGTTAPETTASLDGGHELQAASVQTATGWTADPPSNGNRTITARASGGSGGSGGALLGSSVSQVIPEPLPPISQGSGGDGHVPILVGSKLFAFFHHQYPTRVSCLDRATGALCPGYPKQVNVGASDVPGPGVVVGSKLYTHLLPAAATNAAAYAQTAPVGLYCWDAAKDQPCDLIILDHVQQTNEPAASHPVLAGGKFYMAADTGRLYCWDPATQAACAVASTPTGIGSAPGGFSPDGLDNFDIVTHGTRVFTSRDGNEVACHDIGTGSTCAGWSTPKSFGGDWNLINSYANGSPNGICVVDTTPSGQCVTDADPDTVTSIPWLPSQDGYYSSQQEAETGTRTFVGSLGRGGLGCWDWSTMAVCAGPNFTADGWTAQSLPTAYGATFDGTCSIAVGDPGQVFTVDSSGLSPCTSLSSGTDRRTIDLRDQRCDGTVGSANFETVRLRDSAAGEFTELELTVRDAATGAVLATGDLTAGEVSLAAIDAVAHPSITIDARAISAPGNPAWGDNIFPRIEVTWNSDPQQLCFKTVPPVDCTGALGEIAVNARLTGAEAAQEKRLAVRRASSCAPVYPIPTPTPTGSANDELLGCGDRKIVLVDVIARGGRVRLLGVAVKSLVGRQVKIVFTGNRKVVATARIKADGSFSATAPLPPRSLRFGNKARYLAKVGKLKSLNLKLFRRMQILSVRPTTTKVTISGRVIPPLATKRKQRTITLQRIVNCRSTRDIKRFLPKPNGRFTVTVAKPKGQAGAVYRLRTKVRRTRASRKVSNTFTLPRPVDFT